MYQLKYNIQNTGLFVTFVKLCPKKLHRKISRQKTNSEFSLLIHTTGNANKITCLY